MAVNVTVFMAREATAAIAGHFWYYTVGSRGGEG